MGTSAARRRHDFIIAQQSAAVQIVARQSPAVPGSGTTSFSKHVRPASRAQLAAATTSGRVVARQSPAVQIVARQSAAVPGSGTTSFSKHGRPASRAQLAAATTSGRVVARQSAAVPGAGTTSFSKHGRLASRAQLAAATTSGRGCGSYGEASPRYNFSTNTLIPIACSAAIGTRCEMGSRRWTAELLPRRHDFMSWLRKLRRG
jgi:hypothetical protein